MPGLLTASLPIDPTVIPAFVLAMVMVELTPGPNMGYLAMVASRRGRAAGLLVVAGVTLGLATYLAVALYGLTETPLRAPAVLNTLRWAGAAYLVWLALDGLAGDPNRTAIPLDRRSASGLFARGVMANLLNPKAAPFYIAVLPGFLRPEVGPLALQVLILGSTHIVISVVIHSAIVLGADRAGRLLSVGRRRVLHFVLAVGLIVSAVWLVLTPFNGNLA